MNDKDVIRKPEGAALEYAKHSFSAYRRCTNGCQYCYLNRGVLKKTFGSGKPELRSCFKTEEDVVRKFEQELMSKKDMLIEDGGIFFSFVTDPCLPETFQLTRRCAIISMLNDVPVTILTKMANLVYKREWFIDMFEVGRRTGLLCVGFTLTGHDEMEPNADSNAARIEAMKHLHDLGIKTFASIEPIIDFESSLLMIEKTFNFCDLYKIGLRSGVKRDYYDNDKLAFFIGQVEGILMHSKLNTKVYWKQSVRQRITFPDSSFWTERFGVDADYNIFKQ